MATDRYKYFRVEAAELLEQLTRGVLALEQSGANTESTDRLLRQAHTLKGAARVVRQIEIADAAHAFEDELSRGRSLGVLPEIQILLGLLDQITRSFALLMPAERPEMGDTVKRDAVKREAQSTGTSASQLLRAEIRDVEAVREGVSESLAELSQLRADSAQFFGSRELVELIERQLLAPRLTTTRQYETLLRSTRSVATEVLHAMRRFERRFSATVDRAERELQQAHETVEQLRLVSVGTVFSGLERAVRDAAAELGKEVRFEAQGAEVKLDGHILDAVQRALVQIVRNAVAHGIESSSERMSRGKPRFGVVRLEVRRTGHDICFSCHDDGQGIDVRRLFEAAGLRVTFGVEPSNEELVEVLLRAGVSTAAQLSSVAGRGVGMGIVREVVENARAKVRLTNVPRVGLTLELSVPATLTSLAGLWVDSGEDVMVLPLSDVQRTARLTSAQLVQSGQGECLRIGEELVPYVALHALLGRGAPDVELRSAVVVTCGQERLALGVARVLGSKVQVVHRLPDEVGRIGLASGAVLDAQGTPQLVLDTAALIAIKRQVSTYVRPEVHRRPILVVDDSLTTRMLQQSVLESVGYDVELATSAEQALEMAAAANYGLFLVDVEMPGMDGFSFVECTRQDHRLKDVPSILVSSRSSTEDFARGEAVGAKAYMVKDQYDQRELLRWIRNILGY